MTEKRSHRSSARKYGPRSLDSRKENVARHAFVDDCERTPLRLCNSSRTVDATFFRFIDHDDQRRSSSSQADDYTFEPDRR